MNIALSVIDSSSSGEQQQQSHRYENDDKNVIRINDSTLGDIFYDDFFVITFLKITAFHWEYDYRDHKVYSVLLYIWRISFLALGFIGFIWQMIVGCANITILSHQNPYTSPTNFFIYSCFVYINFILPIFQVSSLIYSMIRIKSFLRITVNRTTILKLLPKIKRNVLIYFIGMILLTIVIVSIIINRSYYETVYQDDIIKDRTKFTTYPLFTFGVLCSNMFLNICEVSFISIALLVFSLKLEQILHLQESMLNAMDQETMTVNLYYDNKERIQALQKSTYFAIQFLTIVAGINWIGLLVGMLSFHLFFIENSNYTYYDMIKDDFVILPYTLKEAIFFFYVLLKAADINSADDRMKCLLVKKCDSLIRMNNKDDDQKQLIMYQSLSLNSIIFPVEFLLLGRRITRNDVIITLLGTLFYLLSLVARADNAATG